MNITLATPVVQQEEIKVTEVEVQRIVEMLKQNKMVAFTNIGPIVLWEGEELDAIHAGGGHTHAIIEARIVERLNA